MTSKKEIITALVLTVMCLPLLAGCFGRTKNTYVVDQYTIDYRPPAVASATPANCSIRIERFTIAPAYSSTSMVIRAGNYKFDTYDYSRWRVSPGDMVGGFILRDITNAALFKATYSYYDSDVSRYVLDGYVEEFGETTDGKGLVGLRITFQDTTKNNPAEQVIFQRTYTRATGLTQRSPNGLAEALSDSMREISIQLTADISSAISANRK